MLLAQLSNQRPWKPIADNRARLSTLFHDYNPEQLIAADPEELVAGLRRLRCGNRADKKQMTSLATNIRTLIRIATEEGTLDAFVTRHAPEHVARLISQPGPYKLLHVGPALALEYLKSVGIRASKPDLHVRRVLSGERLAYAANHPSDWEAYELISAIATEAGCNPTYLDNLLWLFCAQDYGAICGRYRSARCARSPPRVAIPRPVPLHNRPLLLTNTLDHASGLSLVAPARRL